MAEKLPTPRLPSGLNLAMAVVTLVNSGVSWLSWIEVGASRRNSYELFRTAQRFNLDALDPLRFVWFMSPVMTLACLFLFTLQMGRLAAYLLLFQSLLVAGVSLAVLLVALGGGASTALGPMLGLASGLSGIGLVIASIMSKNFKTRI